MENGKNGEAFFLYPFSLSITRARGGSLIAHVYSHCDFVCLFVHTIIFVLKDCPRLLTVQSIPVGISSNGLLL